jgi:hypothetical protein
MKWVESKEVASSVNNHNNASSANNNASSVNNNENNMG